MVIYKWSNTAYKKGKVMYGEGGGVRITEYWWYIKTFGVRPHLLYTVYRGGSLNISDEYVIRSSLYRLDGHGTIEVSMSHQEEEHEERR